MTSADHTLLAAAGCAHARPDSKALRLELATLKDLVWYASGQSGFRGALLTLSRKLDETFLTWAAMWQAEERSYPLFIRAAELAKLDYLSSFPQLATFPVHLAQQEANIEAFVGGLAAADPARVELTQAAPIEDLLTPAACYHLYIDLQGQQLDAPKYLTTRNTCFRQEAYYAPLERQSAFGMREIVCLGTLEEVSSFLSEQQKRLETLFAAWRLPITFETATDPFFQPSRSAKAFAQRVAPSKTEMVFDKRLAIGSLNLHRNYFGETFRILRDAAPAYSGCVAFGIERWMAAVLHTYGVEHSEWPELLR